MRPMCFMKLALLSFFSLTMLIGCQGDDSGKKDKEKEATEKNEGHKHGDDDALYWPKRDVKHEGFVISLGHHGNHFHGGDKLEPAVAISQGDVDVSAASMTCQLMDGETAIGDPVAMVFEPKTEEEPAHYAQGELEFPKEEKTYQVHFVVNLPGVEAPYKDSIDVLCGH